MKNNHTKQPPINPALPLSESLNRLMDAAGIDGVQLSKKTGIPVTTINRLRKPDPTNNPTLGTLVPLAEFFSITVSQLIGEDVVIQTPASLNKIPLLSWEQSQLWLHQREICHGFAWTATDLVLRDGFAIMMEGDSMSPQFPDGTLLILESATAISNRDFALIHQRNQTKPVFKQILIDGSDYYMKSLNPDFKELKKLHLGEDHQVIGVMVQAKMMFKNSNNN